MTIIGMVPYVPSMSKPSRSKSVNLPSDMEIQLEKKYFLAIQDDNEMRENWSESPTNLGRSTEIKNIAISRSMKKVVLGDRGVPLILRKLNADEKNMGAIPTTGNGNALMIPHGRSRATAGTKAQVATMRGARCWSAF